MAEATNQPQLEFLLWSRFWRLFLRKVRPTMRDAVVAGITGIAAFALKGYQGHLRWSFSLQNLLEAQFPIVAVIVVFCIFHLVKTGRELIKQMERESGEIEYDPYPSVVLPRGEKITAKKRNETPLLKTKVILLSGICIVAFCAFGIFSWKASAMFSNQTSQTNAFPSPAPSISPTVVYISPSPSPSPLPSAVESDKKYLRERQRKKTPQSKRRPCGWEERLLGKC